MKNHLNRRGIYKFILVLFFTVVFLSQTGFAVVTITESSDAFNEKTTIVTSFQVLNSHGNAKTQDVHLISGEVAFWIGEEAEITLPNSASFSSGKISADGSFSILLPKPPEEWLEPIREYEDDDCLTSTNENSLYQFISYFNISKDDTDLALIYKQSPLLTFQRGEGYQELHYYSEATTVTGRCAVTYDDGFTSYYLFPELHMRQGWNVVTGVITKVTDDSEVYTFSLADSSIPLRWELERPFESPEDDYIGVGLYTDSHKQGLVVTELMPEQPAEKAGLEEGDIITHMDGENIAGMNWGATGVRFLGEIGEVLHLTVLRPSERGDESFDIEVVRELIKDE